MNLLKKYIENIITEEVGRDYASTRKDTFSLDGDDVLKNVVNIEIVPDTMSGKNIVYITLNNKEYYPVLKNFLGNYAYKNSHEEAIIEKEKALERIKNILFNLWCIKEI